MDLSKYGPKKDLSISPGFGQFSASHVNTLLQKVYTLHIIHNLILLALMRGRQIQYRSVGPLWAYHKEGKKGRK